MIAEHQIQEHPINETATKPSEPSAIISTSNENPYRLTKQEADEMVLELKEMIQNGVIQNTQFKIDEPETE